LAPWAKKIDAAPPAASYIQRDSRAVAAERRFAA
jgi:hypothetical protein